MTAHQTLASLALSILLTGAALAQVSDVKVEGAWARASVPGQKGTGAFMKLTAPQGARLVGVASPAAGVAEVHEMKLDGDVMRMRPVPLLELPAGKAVELKPGGYHVMLLDLKAPLAKDSTVPLTLTFKDAKGAQSTLELSVPVASSAPGLPAAAPAAGHGHKH
jgi:copper(I)-binding protein